MIGIELAKGNRPLDSVEMLNVKHSFLKKGLLMHTCGHYSNVFRYMGALNIPRELNSKGMEIFSSELKKPGK